MSVEPVFWHLQARNRETSLLRTNVFLIHPAIQQPEKPAVQTISPSRKDLEQATVDIMMP